MAGIQQIAITSWPGGRQPAPGVACYPVMLSDGAIAVDWEAKGEPGDAWLEEMPPELYLRELLDLDLDDPLAMADFVHQHGWFCKPDWQSLPRRLTHEASGIGQLSPHLFAIDALIGGVSEARRARLRGQPAIWETTRAYRGFIHLDEMRVHAQLLRSAVRVWDALTGGRTLEQAREEWEGELGLPQMLRHGHWDLGTAALVCLQETVNAALGDFHLRLELRDADLRTDDDPQPTAYEALALQLFNDVATNTAYRRCANEPCGRLFAPVPMSEKYGSGEFHGEKYCSVQCARAQSQREYRRRKAEKAATEDS